MKLGAVFSLSCHLGSCKWKADICFQACRKIREENMIASEVFFFSGLCINVRDFRSSVRQTVLGY